MEIKTHIVEGKNHNERVAVLDEIGPGGAHHSYALGQGDRPDLILEFQKGGIQEVGINGISNEQLLAVLIDRFEGFLSGPFPAPETAEALEHCRTAMEVLHERTLKRMARDVEGRTVA